MKFKRKACICLMLVLTIFMSTFSVLFGGFAINAEAAEKLVFSDDFERNNTEVSSNTQNGDGYGVGNSWNEATYGYAKIEDGKLVMTNGGNMFSSRFMTNRLFRPDQENSLNQTVTITVDASEIKASRLPVLWTRLQPVIWKRNTATGYYMYLDGNKVYFGTAIANVDANLTSQGHSCPLIADGAVGEITVTFSVTQKDEATTTLSATVSGYTADGTELVYDNISAEDATADLQKAGNAGVSFIDGNGGEIRINSFKYSTTDAEAPVRIKIDDFEGATIDSAWKEVAANTLSLENGCMTLAYSSSYGSHLNNRVQYKSDIYEPTVSQFVSVEVPVTDVDYRTDSTQGASYPIIWLRDQTVNDKQIGYFMRYNGNGISIYRRGTDGVETTLASSGWMNLNGENYAQDDNVIFQFSAIGTNPTVLQARIYGSYGAAQEQQSLVASVDATDSDETLEIETAGVPSISVYRTQGVLLPLHIDKFVYYTTGAVDYSTLNDTIDEALAILDKSDEYKEDSISGLDSAIANAQSVLTAGGATQEDVDKAVAELKDIIESSKRFPKITKLLVNGIPATLGDNDTYDVLLSKTAQTAKFDVVTNFNDGVTVAVSDGETEGNTLSFAEDSKAYTVNLSYNGETESYTVNATRSTKHAIVVESGENGSITGEGVTYIEDGGSVSFPISANNGYNVKSLLIDGAAVATPANSTVDFTDITGDHTVYADFEKTLVMIDSATVSFEGTGGLRFSADVSASGVEHLEAQVKAGVISSYTFGTVMLPYDLLDDGEELTLATENVLNIKRTVWKNAETSGYNRMTAVITDVHAKNYTRGISARAYLTVTDKNGESTTIYSDFNKDKNTVILRNLAKELINSGTEYTEEQILMLKDFAQLPGNVNATQQALLDEKLDVRHITVEAGLDTPFSFALVTDSHLISVDGEYDSEDQKTSAKARKIYFKGAEEKLARAMAYFDATEGLKKIIHMGDVVDASTTDTWLSFVDIMGERLDNTIIAPGNHEFTDYTDGFPADAAARDAYYAKFESYMKNEPNFHSEIINGVNLVAMDNALEYFTADQVTKLQAEIDKGYPIILFYHVPLSIDGLAAEDTIVMNEDTRAMYDLINANSDIIKAAFCGHTHKEYNGFFDGGVVPQYVLNATYGGEGGRMSIVTVK